MAEENEDLPRALRQKPNDLDVLGINELNEYIAELGLEIQRARVAIEDKEQQKVAAAAVFKN